MTHIGRRNGKRQNWSACSRWVVGGDALAGLCSPAVCCGEQIPRYHLPRSPYLLTHTHTHTQRNPSATDEQEVTWSGLATVSLATGG